MDELQLVTVASYSEVYQADLARAALEDEGIFVKLNGVEFASMLAGGGTSLMVWESDAERARLILASLNSDPIDDEELARQALAVEPDDEFSAPVIPIVLHPDIEPGSEEEQAARKREDYARRFLHASVLALLTSLFCGLVWYYAIYLGLIAQLSSGRLSSEGRKRLIYGWIAIFANAMFWIWVAVMARRFFGDY